MDHSEIPPAPFYSHFTNRARGAMMDVNQLAIRRKSDAINSLFIVIAAIQRDERIRLAIPQLQLTESILDKLAEQGAVDKPVHAKELIMNALAVAQLRNSRTIDTTHLVLAAVTSPSPAVLALVAEVDLIPADVADIISKMLDDGDA
ncbi:MAG: hypothetical protein WCJ09_19085 [Planctomycetota bacterium]